jgi:hypothetical protein
MRIERENVLLRAFFDSVEKVGSLPAYEAFERAAEEAGCRGATVFRGVEGLARGRRLGWKALSVSEDLPVVVEVIDAAGRIDGLVRRAAPLLRGRFVTRERAAVVVHRRKSGGKHPEETPGTREEGPMPREEKGTLVRVFLSETDRHGKKPLAREILDRAAEAGMEMALVLKSPAGFGAHRRERSDKSEVTSLSQPVVVEIADTEERVQAFLPRIDEVLVEGLVTVEAVTILRAS